MALLCGLAFTAAAWAIAGNVILMLKLRRAEWERDAARGVVGGLQVFEELAQEEVASLKAQNLALADRVAKQSELLSRRAEASRPYPPSLESALSPNWCRQPEAEAKVAAPLIWKSEPEVEDRVAACERAGYVAGWIQGMRRLMVCRGLPFAPKQFSEIRVSEEFYDKLRQHQESRSDHFDDLAPGLKFRGVPVVRGKVAAPLKSEGS